MILVRISEIISASMNQSSQPRMQRWQRWARIGQQTRHIPELNAVDAAEPARQWSTTTDSLGESVGDGLARSIDGSIGELIQCRQPERARSCLRCLSGRLCRDPQSSAPHLRFEVDVQLVRGASWTGLSPEGRLPCVGVAVDRFVPVGQLDSIETCRRPWLHVRDLRVDCRRKRSLHEL
jgi:hypothetical protein